MIINGFNVNLCEIEKPNVIFCHSKKYVNICILGQFANSIIKAHMVTI